MIQDPKGPWSGATIEDIKREFKAFVERGERPELFPGVRPYNIAPPEEGIPRVVCPVAPKAQRQHAKKQRVQCNVCSRQQKFEANGYLVVIEGHLYIAGPICGQKHFTGSDFNAAIREYERKLEEEEGIKSLARFLPVANEWLEIAHSLLRYSRLFENAFSTSRHGNSRFFRSLERMTSEHSTQLYIDRVEPRSKATRRVFIGSLRGCIVLSHRRKKTDLRLRAAISDLNKFETGGRSLEDLIDSLEASGNAASLAKIARDAKREITEVREELIGFQEFFTEENWRLLDQFLKDPESGFGGTATAHGRYRRLFTRDATQEPKRQTLPDFWNKPIPPLPDL